MSILYYICTLLITCPIQYSFYTRAPSLPSRGVAAVSCCALTSGADVSAAVPHGDLYQLALDPSLFDFPFLPFVIMSFVPTDEKVAPVPTVELPNYQLVIPTLQDVRHPVHRRRPLRRLFHFFLAALFIWVTARHIIRHCERRRFGPPHFDGLHWVNLR